MNTSLHSEPLRQMLYSQLDASLQDWLSDRIKSAVEAQSARDFFLTYTLIGRKFPKNAVVVEEGAVDFEYRSYIIRHQITLDQLARIYILSRALELHPDYFIPKTGTLMQTADTSELITFLRFLYLLPHAEAFADIAVDALRTNIADVFDSIALDNPYPQLYFNEGQWNQMYLKAAFMQRNLLKIQGVDERANAALTRIISDYAHERWAASREIDPHIWRPVSSFLDEVLLLDMKRLLNSSNLSENRAGFLCCLNASDARAKTLIARHPLQSEYQLNAFDWQTLTN